jgi:phage terminase small subunit
MDMARKNRFILKFLENPNTWDRTAFETMIREEVQASTGEITASDELLIGSLVLTVDTLLTAEINIREGGLLYAYNSGDATGPWYKIRTDMIDKSIKILGELGLVARGRPKLKSKASDVDELFANA